MAQKIIRGIPLNRVEGDLEIKVEVADGVVSDAWSSGIMFRGIENIMIGRGAMDGLVITPRVCGLCSVCHLKTAAKALDMIAGVKIPDDAIRIRNVSIMTEHLQSDIRHGFLMFATDFANAVYKDHPLYKEAVSRYEALKGSTVVETIRESKKLLEIIGIFGGQWPHTSFIVPGGIASLPGSGDVLAAMAILKHFRNWYENKVLGCSIDKWIELKSLKDLEKWADENDAQRESEMGFYIRFARKAGLHTYGKGHGNFLSYGAFDLPEQSKVVSLGKGTKFIPAGYAKGTRPGWFDQQKVLEHVQYSWFEDYPGGKHPLEGETKPYATGAEAKKYSWIKAPRYDGEPAETGPLAEMIMSEHPLFTDIVAKEGPSVFVRQLARLARTSYFLPAMETWLKEFKHGGKVYEKPKEAFDEGTGYGITQAARGALGHWVKIKKGKIEQYQIITPTAWNAAPRDSKGVRGPWEEALIGTKVKDIDNPVELGHVIRSYDSCMVCSVHTLEKGKTLSKTNI